jgi:hypothetical protein
MHRQLLVLSRMHASRLSVSVGLLWTAVRQGRQERRLLLLLLLLVVTGLVLTCVCRHVLCSHSAV